MPDANVTGWDYGTIYHLAPYKVPAPAPDGIDSGYAAPLGPNTESEPTGFPGHSTG